ncbi:MAG: radical SAM protein [Nitrospirae bacterium]|nr:radical SAM protein [Nitrospirota bacterium]
MESLLLRREPFGGVLAEREGTKVKFLNHTGFEITYGIANGWSEDEIINHIKSKFDVSNMPLVKNDIKKFRRMVSNIKDWDSGESLWKDPSENKESSPIPALSAPLDLYWEVTKRCNLYCRHCYNESGSRDYEPSMEQMRSVVNELSSTKLRSIAISGGEPLMRKDLRTIIGWLRPLATNLVLATNGTLIDEQSVAWMGEMINEVNLSLDAGNKSAYEQFRGRRGTFDKCLRGLDLLVEQKVPVIIQTTISRFNIDSLKEIATLAIERGATAWIVRLPVFSGRAARNEGDFLSRNELIEKEPLLSEIRLQYQSKFADLQLGVNFMWSYQEPYTYVQIEDRAISCSAGTVGVLLTAEGTLAPCPLFSGTDFKSDAVWNGNFLKEWKTARCMQTMRSLRLNQIGQCFHCAHFKVKCSAGCRAKSYLSGDLYSTDPDCGYLN